MRTAAAGGVVLRFDGGCLQAVGGDIVLWGAAHVACAAATVRHAANGAVVSCCGVSVCHICRKVADGCSVIWWGWAMMRSCVQIGMRVPGCG